MLAVVAPRSGPRCLGVCVGCGTKVYGDEPHHRYRGDIMHAEPCAERRARAALQTYRT